MGPIPPDPTPEYNYSTTQGQENETLISLNRNWNGGQQWSWVVYENGVEVGHQLTEPDFPATSLSIESFDQESSPKIYGTTSATADVTSNPINNSQVEYFNLTSKSVGIPLTVGVGIT